MNILFVSLGCDKNLVDSEVMLGMLKERGYTFTDDQTQADAAVVNTCCFISDAKEESVNTILDMAERRKNGQLQALLVTGCLAQRYSEEMQVEIPEVDAVLGTTAIDAIADALDEVLKGQQHNYIEDINKKYPKQEDALKKQQATMELYKRAGVSAMGGCLPTLLTFPILWAMFRFFPASIELRQQSFLWAEDLSAYDSIVDFGVRVPLLGDHLSLFALLMAVVMWGYSKITMSQQPTSDDPSAKSMQFMSVWMMPIMMFFICNSLSSGLSYYYLVSQLISMVEIFIIRKWCVKPQAVIAKVEASKGKPLPKSKWQQRLEEAQKLQQQQMKQQQRKR